MRKLAILVALATLSGVALVGCGEDDDNEATDNNGGGAVTTPAVEADVTVTVALSEKSDDEYTMTVDPTSVAAGAIAFEVTNEKASEKKHEMVVMKTDTPADQLKPRANDPDKVEEEGEIEEVELEPGQSRTLTLDLEPGKYVLVCNIAKHYAKGMYSAFEVT